MCACMVYACISKVLILEKNCDIVIWELEQSQSHLIWILSAIYID